MALILIAVGGRSAEAAGEIGNVHLVKVWAYGTPPQTQRAPLYRADDLFADELIETVENGALHVRFLDKTKLRLGSSSRVTLDSFVYDPDTGAGEMVADLGEGVFRFITGKLNKEGFQIRTPAAVIGMRGTDFVVVAPDGATTVSVLEGLIEVTARGGGGDSAGVGIGQAVLVSAVGQVSLGAASSLPDPGLADDGGRSPQSGGGGGGGDGGNSGSD